MRLFTAIDIPPAVRSKLAALLDRLRPLANMRWAPVDNLHITIKFIGEWPEARRAEVEQALASASPSGPVEVAIKGLGWFPTAHNPRVFWAGVHGGAVLNTIAQTTESALAAIGIPKEDREFQPHLTLARTRDRLSKDSLAALRRAIALEDSDDFGSFRAVSQALYLSAAGKYSKLHEVSLIPS